MSVGAALAEARERAGLSVRQLSERTRIRETVIQRFEGDDFSVGDFYTRGHLRTIASDLGLDPDELVRQYAQEHPGGDSPIRTSSLFGGAAVLRERGHRGSGWTMAVAVALAIVVIVVIARMLGGSGDRTGPTAVRLPANGQHGQHGQERHDGAREGRSLEEAFAPGLVVVKVTTRKPSWIAVKDAKGKAIFEGTLPEGKTETYSAKDRVKMVIGDAGAVRLVVNGKDLGAPGRDGQMVRRTFAAGGPSPR
ncbi:helix-turn-helix domain-containing protein [Microbispora sp. NBC_01189]|uniref:helix-turn-helix domain-containing protein n=1 Tax=unclassified Microbispora TaxID=2614687 RepID=UPI002E11E8B5|nr:helix-turn-helix domain-containing protein [Microbispora sp. NBC_01189]